MRVVIDTDVVVSGLFRPLGPPGRVVRMVTTLLLDVCHDARILTEYREVLERPKFRSVSADEADAFLEFVEKRGTLVNPISLIEDLPDPDDNMFLEVALGGNASHLITGNLKHYPPSRCQGMVVLSPADFLEECPGR